ncbi:MAG: leucyl/phenylalanyl-tRNA--protein transferase [Pseudomonadota bacterium]
MKDAESSELELTPALLLRAYEAGVFPMAEAADSDKIFWVDPRQRGILPLDGFHLPRSLRKRLKRGDHTVTVDRAFSQVLEGCADRDETWINPEITALYTALHHIGHAHSVEVWQGPRLLGGLYGVRIGGAFFGESMFSAAPDGSKIALAHLVARLRHGGFSLLDTQFTTPHLEGLGAFEIPRAEYRHWLDKALGINANFYSLPASVSPEVVIHLITHTSYRG